MKVYVLIAMIFWSCTESTEHTKNDVRIVVSGILDADNHADIERVLSFYHDDPDNYREMPPGRDEIRGIANIRRNYEGIFASSVLNLAPEEEEITISDGFAVYKGRTKGQAVIKSDSTTRVINDKFLMILKNDNGSWKITTLIWN